MPQMLLSPTPADQAHSDAPRAECRKVPYPNPVKAWRVIRAAHWLSAKKRYKRCTAYPCPICHQWHITTQCRHDYPAADWR